MITPEQLKAKWEESPTALTKAMQGCLVEFGYDNLTTDAVETVIRNYYDGKEANEIIGMFVSDWLKNGVD